MKKVYLAKMVYDGEYGDMRILKAFDSREKAEKYIAQLIADRDEDDDFDENGKWYPWWDEEEKGEDYFKIEELDVE